MNGGKDPIDKEVNAAGGTNPPIEEVDVTGGKGPTNT